MHNPDIDRMLNEFRTTKDLRRKQEILRIFIGDINCHRSSSEDREAESVVRHVLMLADEPHVNVFQHAEVLKQLCRAHLDSFAPDEDMCLFRMIALGHYFDPPDLSLETQDGIV